MSSTIVRASQIIISPMSSLADAFRQQASQPHTLYQVRLDTPVLRTRAVYAIVRADKPLTARAHLRLTQAEQLGIAWTVTQTWTCQSLAAAETLKQAIFR